MVKIHVHQQTVRSNRKNGTNDPPLSVIRGRSVTRHHEVEILGPSRVVYSPDKPLKCGARIWIEAEEVRT